MKFPESELNIGDSLWSLSNNKPVELIVESIQCRVYPTGHHIRYGLFMKDKGNFKSDTEETSIGKDMFKSKRDLMLNVFNDCVEEMFVIK